ncbi:MAG TPA: hypothetical protein VN035_13230 [Microbacterium sp.]|nr:hypothetical protein [Microbacterium sp.]
MALLLSDRAALVSPLPLYTNEEASACGIDLASKRWLRLRKGVYVDAEQYAGLKPWERYRVRVHAFLRRHPAAILCLESAGVVHGLPAFGETKYIHVYDPDAPRSQCFGDVRLHTSAMLREVELVGGILVTSLLDTVVDLARVMQPADALAVVDAAISPVQGGTLLLGDLIARGKEGPGSRGRLRMKAAFESANALSESPGESISRAAIVWSGYEPPVLQAEFHYEGHTDRCDFLFEGCAGLGESDGWGKYEFEDAEKAAQHLADEKRREDRLRRHRHPFARWETSDAWAVKPLCAALDGAGIPRLFPSNPTLIATLRFRPRATRPARGET